MTTRTSTATTPDYIERDTHTTRKVTRYDGTTGYEVHVDGVKVGEVHRYRGRWAWSVSARGKYGNGTAAATKAKAAHLVATIATR